MPTELSDGHGSVDWELLHLTTETVSASADDGEPVVERVTADRFRLRVRAAGRIGESWTDGSAPSQDQLGEALAAAGRGPCVHDAFGAGYPRLAQSPSDAPPADIASVALRPHVLRAARRRRTVRLATSGGAQVRWTHEDMRVVCGVRQNRRSTPVAVFDSGPIPDGIVATLPAAEVRPVERRIGSPSPPWLLSPTAVSQLFGRAWLAGLSATGARRPSWPPACTIADPGPGAPTDLEGTRRRSQVHVRDGRVETPLRTLADVGRQRHCTGHAGTAGVDPDDLVLSPDTPLENTGLPAACLIVAARPLPAAPDVVVLTSMVPPVEAAPRLDSLLVRVRLGSALLSAGRWTTPFQRGIGCWSMPWLRLDEPGASLAVLELLDREDG